MIELCNINYVPSSSKTIWTIKAMIYNKRCPVEESLLKWKRKALADFKAINKVMGIVATADRVLNERHVIRCETHSNVYEMRAHKLNRSRYVLLQQIRKFRDLHSSL